MALVLADLVLGFGNLRVVPMAVNVVIAMRARRRRSSAGERPTSRLAVNMDDVL
jgi:hypothetical protein